MSFTPKAVKTAKTIEHLENTYVPTLFIGLGGTGKDVLMRLRKRLYDKDGPQPRPYLRYLMLDTDKLNWCPANCSEQDYEPVRPAPGDMIDCQINEQQFYQVFDLLEKEHDQRFATWLKPSLRQLGHKTVANGAGTWRQFGRMAFMLQYEVIRERIQNALLDMFDNLGRLPAGSLQGATIEPSTLEVVIVTSLAGGTGSGMFLDMAYLVRDVINSRSALAGLARKYVTVIGVLPTVFEKVERGRLYKKFQQNAYASLLELEYYGTAHTADEMFVGKVDGGERRTHSVGFHAPWRRNQFIEGQGWSVCYLIDNVNPLCRETPLGVDETFQMIADYLFLDFQRSDFAKRKRSNRCNLSQYQNDMIAVEVRKPGLTQEIGSAFEQDLDVVYAAKSGCAFSSFGLSEISFSRARVYRAAAYLLASRVVLEHWLGSEKSLHQSQYEDATRVDFYKHGAAEGKLTFLPDGILQRLYQGTRSNWFDDARGDCQQARGVHFTDGTATLKGLLAKHQSLLSSGQALQTLKQNSLDLAGSPTDLGPLRKRVLEGVRRRANQFGVAMARELINYYRAAAEVVPGLVGKQVIPAVDGMGRLAEADTLFIPARKVAQKIEFPRACDMCEALVLNQYRAAAAPRIRELMSSVRDYIGERGRPRPMTLSHHGTIYEWLERAEEQLNKIGSRLRTRFEEFGREQGSDRSQILSPTTWTEVDYNNQINRLLVTDPSFANADNSGFSWRKFEERLFTQLRADRPQDFGEGIDSLTALLDSWFEQAQHGDEAIKRIAEVLATACRNILWTKELDLANYFDGAVIDLLAISHQPAERRDKLQKLIRTSEPYLPMDTMVQAMTTGGYRPEPDSLMGLQAGDIPTTSLANKESIKRDLLGCAQEVHADLTSINELVNDKTSLVLCREVWGVPLRFYDNLERLYEAYIDRGVEVDECHINTNMTWEELPEIRAIQSDVYEQISRHIDDVLFAMIRGTITYRSTDRSYIVRVPNPIGGVDTWPLGRHISRIVKKACEQEAVRVFLQRNRSEWETKKGSPRNWAMLYASAVWVYEYTRRERGDDRRSDVSPLRNCAAALLKRFERQLQKTDEGQRWLAHFRLPDEVDDPQAKATWDAIYDDLINVKKVLVRPSEFVPIYEINWNLVDLVQLPPAS
jgi:hypothetical protein